MPDNQGYLLFDHHSEIFATFLFYLEVAWLNQ